MYAYAMTFDTDLESNQKKSSFATISFHESQRKRESERVMCGRGKETGKRGANFDLNHKHY